MKARAGVRTCAFGKRGTLFGLTPENVVVMGLRGETKLAMEPFNESKTFLNQFLPNMTNFRMETQTFQTNLKTLQYLHILILDETDAQIITVPQGADVSSGGVFNFTGDNYPGLDFEFNLSLKERLLKVITEFAAEESNAKALLAESLINAPLDLSAYGTGKYVINKDKYVRPAFVSVLHGGSAVFSKEDLTDFKLSIKTKDSGKTGYNRSRVNYYSILVELTGYEATIARLTSELDKNRFDALTITQKYDDSTNDVFEFQAGVLSKKEILELGDQNRTMKVIYQADIPVIDLVFDNLVGDEPHRVRFEV